MPEPHDPRNPRVALRLPVELGHGDFEDAFAASAVNLSKGGMSMRAACLPDPGTRLLCRFRAQPAGTLVTASGEVVWAHLDDEQSGEFGLAFVDLDPDTEWAIEEMIATHAKPGDPGAPGEAAAPVAQLELEGSGEAISARVARNEGATVVFEQPLDLLSLGRGVHAHAGDGAGRKGSIAGVELRMVGAVPMLAVTVSFDGRASGLSRFPAGVLHDTAPDTPAPGPAGSPARATLLEFDAEQAASASAAGSVSQAAAESEPDEAFEARDVEPQAASELGELEYDELAHAAEDPYAYERPTAKPGFDAPSELEPDEPERDHSEVASALRAAVEAGSVPPPPPPLQARPEGTAVSPKSAAGEREPSRAFRVPAIDPDDEAELAAMFAPPPSAAQVALTRVLLALRVHGGAVLRASGPVAGAALDRALPAVRGVWLRAAAITRALVLDRVGPQLGALRRVLGALIAPRRRRKTTAPSRVAVATAERTGMGRTLVLALTAALAVGMAIYAFAPMAAEDELDVHRAVTAPRKARKARKPKPSEPVASEALVAPDPAQVPSASSVPSGSPFAVDVRAQRTPSPAPAAQAPAPSLQPAPAAGKALRFGAPSVPRGKRFTLRMSARITALQGAADAGGFTVVALGGLALDRAGPIRSVLPVVTRSMIINKGDRAELTIRFADGKQPAYQVTADGSSLQITIQDL